MTVKGGTSPACAACKYQRRRCSSKCPLAPYFPATEPNIFQNAHKLFGVSNIMKILNKMETRDQRDEVMKSIKFESYLRERFPVDGCVGYIKLLQDQLAQYTQEYLYVSAKLAICREEFRDQLMDHQYSPSSELQLAMTLGNDPSLVSVLPHHPGGQMLTPYEVNHYPMNANDEGAYVELADEIRKQLWVQDLNYNNVVDHNDQIAIQMQMDYSQALQTQLETEVDYNGVPFDSIDDDRKSYIEPKEACDSSCGSSWKDAAESVSKNELKSAAAFFHLTSVN